MGKQLTATMREKSESLVTINPNFKAAVSRTPPSSIGYIFLTPHTFRSNQHIFTFVIVVAIVFITVGCQDLHDTFTCREASCLYGSLRCSPWSN